MFFSIAKNFKTRKKVKYKRETQREKKKLNKDQKKWGKPQENKKINDLGRGRGVYEKDSNTILVTIITLSFGKGSKNSPHQLIGSRFCTLVVQVKVEKFTNPFHGQLVVVVV